MNDTVKIYSVGGVLLFETPINEGSKRAFALGGEDYITLKFSLGTPQHFPLGSWAELPDIGRFEVAQIQRPTYNAATGGYDYELKLEAQHAKWRNKICFYRPKTGAREAEWSLTATAAVHLSVVLDNLQALGYTYRAGAVSKPYVADIDSTVPEVAKLIQYSGTSIADAVTAIAEAWECEAWVTENIIHLGRCEHGASFDIIPGVNAESMPSSQSKTDYATRIYVFGSERNLPTNYRETSGTGITVNGIVQKRLMLPEDTPYIDARPGMTTEEAVEAVVVLDSVYPRTSSPITGVTSYTHTATETAPTTGEEVERTETFYRFAVSGLTFREAYLLPETDLQAHFESGALGGMEFSLKFNPDGEAETLPDGSINPAAQWFEVVASESYGAKLPDTVLYPKTGDKVVIFGWDVTKVADLGLIAAAEHELLEKAGEEIAKMQIDPSTYSCPMMSDWVLEQGTVSAGEEGTRFVFPHSLGQRVRLVSEANFASGYRESRIIGIEYPLDIPYDTPTYTVGETARYSRLGDLQQQIDTLVLDGKTYERGSGGAFYLIGTGDSTPPTDRNVYSALRSDRQYLRKDRDDYTPHALRVGDRLVVPAPVNGLAQGSFTDDWQGVGAGLLWNKKTQTTDLWVDRIFARDSLETMKLRFNMIDVIAGEQWQTFAYGTVDKVWRTDDGLDNLTIELLDGEMLLFKPGDIVRGIFHNIDYSHSALDNDNTATRLDDCGFTEPAGFYTVYLAVRFLTDIDGNPVTDAEGNFIEGKNLADAKGFAYVLRAGRGQHHPQHGIKLAAYGNFTDKQRQATTFANTRRLVMLEGVDTWIIDPAKHYRYVRGDIEGLEIGGTVLHGHGLLISNAYIHGSLIHLSDEQRKELAGADAYTVSLTAETGVLHIGADGLLPSPAVPFWLSGNAVNEEGQQKLHGLVTDSDVTVPDNLVTADGRKIVAYDQNKAALTAEGSRLWTSLTVMRGGKALSHSTEDTIPDEGQYTVTLACSGCTAVFRGGILRVTSLEGEAVTDDKGNITGYRDDGRARSVTLTVNCEGIASVTRTYTITTVADGEGAQSVLQSFVFLRVADHPSTPTGGTFSSPIPDDGAGWTDGPTAIDPDNPLPLWASHRIFTSDGRAPQEAAWSIPAILADSADMDVCYHDGEERPLDPPDGWHGAQDGSEACNGWYNEATDSTVWMAVARYRNGSWGAWSVMRVRGETGESPCRLDLSNEYDTILIDPQDKVYALDDEYYPSTQVRLFAGGKALSLSSLEIIRQNASEVLAPSQGQPGDIMTEYYLTGLQLQCHRFYGTDGDGNPYGLIQITEASDTMPDRAVLRIRATATADGKTVVGVADWALAKKYGDCIYNLVPEVTQVHVDGDGVITNPELSDGYLKCEIQAIRRKSNGGITMLAEVPEGMNLTVDEATPQGSMGGGFTYSTGVGVDGVAEYGTTDYAFTLEEKQHDGSWQLVDRENVPVVRDGAKGSAGQRGLPGYQIRLWKQISADQEFRNDQLYDDYVRENGGTEREGSGYIDFLAVRCPAMASGWAVYRYNSRDPHEAEDPMGRSSEISKVDTAEPYDTSGLAELLPNDHVYWTPVALNEASGFFDTLIANYALIDVLAGTQFLVRNEGNDVVGGLQGADADRPIFWAGADRDHISDAPVRIYANGHAEIAGSFLAGIKEGQRIYIDPDTGDITIYDTNGKLRTTLTGSFLTPSMFTQAPADRVYSYQVSNGIDMSVQGSKLSGTVGLIAQASSGSSGMVTIEVETSGQVTLAALGSLPTGGPGTATPTMVPSVTLSYYIADSDGKTVWRGLAMSAQNQGEAAVTIHPTALKGSFFASEGQSYYLCYEVYVVHASSSGLSASASASADTDVLQSVYGSNGFAVRRSERLNYGVIEEEDADGNPMLTHYRNGVRQPYTVLAAQIYNGVATILTAPPGFVTDSETDASSLVYNGSLGYAKNATGQWYFGLGDLYAQSRLMMQATSGKNSIVASAYFVDYGTSQNGVVPAVNTTNTSGTMTDAAFYLEIKTI